MARIKFFIGGLLFFICCSVFATEKLTLVLDWFVNPDHAPIFVAEQQGFFKAQGLDVTIIPPADPSDPPKLVAAGKADLGVTYQPQLMLDVNQGLPIIRIATLVATPLDAIAVLKDSHINSLKDLKGKTIGYASDGVDHAMLVGMLNSAGLTLKDVTLVNVHYDLTQALLAHKVDAITGVVRNFEIPQIKLAGFTPYAFYPEEHGIPIYDELIIVTNKKNVNDPRLKKFIIALNQGVQYLVNHPESSWQTFAKQHPELNNQLNHDAWLATIPRFSLTPAALDQSRYQQMADYLVNLGQIKPMPVSQYAVSIRY